MSCLNCGQEIHEGARFCARCGAPQTGGRDGGLAVLPPSLLGNEYMLSLRRYWWLLLLGVGVAAVAAIAMVYRIDFGSVPPTLEKREQLTYTASARILVTSAEAPYFRTSVTREVPGPEGEEPQEVGSAPDLGTLISTANLYPILIESDEVRRIRDEEAGPLPGLITTRAIYEVNSPSRFELSQVPVVEVYGSAGSPAAAIGITQATVDAFMTYVDGIQDNAGLERRERILLEELERPEAAIASGGTSLSLPFMVFTLISGAFVALAILLGRLFPFGLQLSRRVGAALERERETDVAEPGSEPEPAVERQARRPKARV